MLMCSCINSYYVDILNRVPIKFDRQVINTKINLCNDFTCANSLYESTVSKYFEKLSFSCHTHTGIYLYSN